MGRGLRELRSLRLIDLSVSISPSTAEPEPPHIHYVDHRHAAEELAAVANRLLSLQAGTDAPSLTLSPSVFPDSMGLANEKMELDAHAGTHLDAPWHFGPLSGGFPAKTIDEVPLEWCMGPGVILDLRHKQAGDTITPQDLQAALERIQYTLEPGDIVLLMTGADKHFKKKDYFSAHPGMGREATLWLLDQGVRLIGTDGWGFDRPAGAMLKDYFRTGDAGALLPAHMVGREREYCHMEKLANLDQVPVPHGFWVSCLPVKIERGSAGWARVIAMVEREPS